MIFVLLDEHLCIADARKSFERRELEIVRGKERAAADLSLQMFDNGLR